MSLPNSDDCDKLYEKCVEIYEAKGQYAVIEYCNGIQWKYWEYCEPCEYISPVNPHDKTCLVCGSSPCGETEKEG